jgi:ABC-2 type transport system permease protein
MSRALTVAMREYGSFFRIPLGWVVIALFMCLSAVFFAQRTLVPGNPAELREFFGIWWGLLLFISPAISMRLVSEELRSGTIEPMLTSPVGEWTIVMGKYLASVLFLITMLLPTLAFVGVLAWLSRPDYGAIGAGYLGLVLLGMLYLAVGTLASCLTSSQTLAFLGTLFVLFVLDLAPSRLAAQAPEQWAALLFKLSPSFRVADFARGLIDTSTIAFFVLGSFWFVALAAITLQSRRWR